MGLLDRTFKNNQATSCHYFHYNNVEEEPRWNMMRRNPPFAEKVPMIDILKNPVVVSECIIKNEGTRFVDQSFIKRPSLLLWL